MRKINEIIVHATATPADWRPNDTTAGRVAAVKSWHVNGRGWSDIGYHFLIDRDGTVAAGRPVSRPGAHVAGRNIGTIGVSLFGGLGGRKDDVFADHYTRAQDKALRGLIADLQDRFGPGMHLSGHHEYANKACPCFDVRAWYAGVPTDDGDEEPEAPATDEAARLSASLQSIIDMADGEMMRDPPSEKRLRWRHAEIAQAAIEALKGT